MSSQGIGASNGENRSSSTLSPPQHKYKAPNVGTKLKTPFPQPSVQSSAPKTRGSKVPRTKPREKMNKNVEVGPDLDATRSKNDKKRYRLVTLPNGLQVLLISTTDAPESKVGASVAREGSVTIPGSMDMHLEASESDGLKSRPASYVREFSTKGSMLSASTDRFGQALSDPSAIPRQTSYRNFVEEEFINETISENAMMPIPGTDSFEQLKGEPSDSLQHGRRPSHRKGVRRSRGENAKTLPRRMLSGRHNSSAIGHQRSKSTGVPESPTHSRSKSSAGPKRGLGSGVSSGRKFGSAAPSARASATSARGVQPAVPKPLHQRMDSTSLAVDQIHEHAVSNSQQGLNQDAAGAVEHAAAKHAGLKNRLSQSSVQSSSSLRPKKLVGFSSLTRDQSKYVKTTAARQTAASVAAQAAAKAKGGSMQDMGIQSRRRDSGRSIGSEVLGAPAMAKAEERRRSLGRKRQSIPSITMSSSLKSSATSRTRPSVHKGAHAHSHTHAPHAGFERTNSRSSLMDVPHLDHPSVRSDHVGSMRLGNTSVYSSTATLGGMKDVDDSLDGAKEVGLRMAAVSLSVGVGSFSTPEGFDGLAHFLEHMLFMGSKKYPTENAFDAFVSQAGGNSNAYTDTEKTVYHFTCPQEHLAQALDIFAQFFVAPLLLPESADRELKSIESEFTLRQNMDGCRLQEIWRHTSRKSTPFSKFTCGNKQTLKEWPEAAGRDVNKALWDFFQKYYLGPNMKLCILGIDSLDNLQDLATDLFSDVPKKPPGRSSFKPIEFAEQGVPWISIDPSVQSLAQVWPQIIKAQREDKKLPDVLNDLEAERKQSMSRRKAAMKAAAAAAEAVEKGAKSKRRSKRSKSRGRRGEAVSSLKVGSDGVALGCLFRIVPVQDMHELSLTWQLPPLAGLYMAKPTEYIAHLVGHESQGSVLAEAKSRGWATALVASSVTPDGFEHNTACTMFNINITLTRQGLNEWVYVVGMVFEYIGMLIRIKPQKWVHDELQAVSKMQYEFQEEPDALMLAQNVSVWMLPQSKYKSEHLLTGPWLNFEWDPNLITNTLHQLSPKLVRVDLMSSVYGHSDEYKRDEADREPKQNESGNKANEDADDVHRLAEKPSGPPLVEPFTGAQYWADKIPDSILNLWKELYFNRATVGFSESAGTEGQSNSESLNSFPRSLALPPRNPYISTDFDLKPIHSTRSHPIVNAIIRVRRPVGSIGKANGSSNESLMSRMNKRRSKLPTGFLSKSRGLDYEWVRGKIIEFNHKDNMILVRYPRGEFRWHRLPEEKVDWGSIPSPSARKVTLLQKLTLDDGIEFKLIQMATTTVGINRAGVLAGYNDVPSLNYTTTDDSFNTESVAGSFDKSTSPSNIAKKWKGRASLRRKDNQSRPRSKSEVRTRVPWHSTRKADSESKATRVSEAEGSSSQSEDAASTELSVSEWDEDELGDVEESDSEVVSAGFPKLPLKTKAPAMVAGSDKLFTLWHLHDQEFLSPRCEVYLNFMSPVANASPLVASLHDLLALMVFESLNQDSYMAFISELELEIETSGTGLQIHVGGFSHKLPVLLDNVLNKLLQFAMLDKDPDRATHDFLGLGTKRVDGQLQSMSPMELVESPVFFAQFESLITNYINAGSQFRSSGQVSTAMFQILCSDLWSPDIKVRYASYITPDLLKEYAGKFLSECRVTGLVQGNISLTEAGAILDKVKGALGDVGMKPVADDELPVLRILEVPVSPPLVKNATISGMVHVLEALESPAHSVELYFQIGEDSLQDRVVACMIEQLMKEPLYAELRTKQQLGYSVKCGVRSICGTLGFVVEITSEVHGPELLCKDVDDFLLSFRDTLKALGKEAFEQNLAALARNVLEKENGLGEAALKAWSTITNKHYHNPPQYAWNQELQQARALRSSVKLADVISAYDKWLCPSSSQRRRLSVLVVGYGYNTTNLVRMLELPCVQIVESSSENQSGGPMGTKACKCSIM